MSCGVMIAALADGMPGARTIIISGGRLPAKGWDTIQRTGNKYRQEESGAAANRQLEPQLADVRRLYGAQCR